MPPRRSTYDVVVLGGGVAGVTAARILASRGLNTLLLEHGLLGGECLNYGCVPYKTMYRLAEALHLISLYSLEPPTARGLLHTALRRAARVTERLRELLSAELEAAGVEVYSGYGRVCGPAEVCVADARIRFRSLVVATGSEPVIPGGIVVDEERVLTNRGLLGLDGEVESLIVVGGGAVGVEAASIAAALGVRVTLVEAMREILPLMDRELARRLRRELSRRLGIGFILGRRVEGARARGGKAVVVLDDGSRLEADAALIAVGRRPATRGLGLEDAGVEIDEKGFVRVDEHCMTSNPRIYAVGDVTGPPMLAHKAIAEAEVAALSILGKGGASRPEPWRVPVVVYSTPPIAGIGLTEEEARVKYGGVERIKVPLGRVARAWIEGYERGVVKLVMQGGRLLGVHALGPGAGEVVSAAAPLLGCKPAAYVYPHMSMLEALHQALFEALTRG